jgi:hypothetical protein
MKYGLRFSKLVTYYGSRFLPKLSIDLGENSNLHSDAKKTMKSLTVKTEFIPQIGLEINKTFFNTKSISSIFPLDTLCHGSVPIQLTYLAAVLIIEPALASHREPSGLVILTVLLL